MTTPLEDKVSILAELWLHHRNDEEFEDFFEYNDLGLPLAFALDNKIVDTTKRASEFIEETFSLLLDGFDLEDTGYETLDDILAEDGD